MALISCSECGAQISDRAPACPRCGNPSPAQAVHRPPSSAQRLEQTPASKQKTRPVFIILGALLVVALIYAALSADEKSAQPTTASVTETVAAPATPTIQPQEAQPSAPTRPLEISMDSLPGWPAEQPTTVSLVTMNADYQANEVAADNRYKGHLLAVTGKINSISKNLFDATYLALDIDGQLLDTTATLNERYLPTAAKLSKGQVVTLICVGAGKALTPDLKDCAIGAVDGMSLSTARTEAPSQPSAVSTIEDNAAPSAAEPLVHPTATQSAPNAPQPTPQPINPITAAARPVPSFDCAVAKSVAEQLICGDDQLAALDRDLDVVYRRAKAAAIDQSAFKESVRQEWNYREQTCHDKDCLVRWYAAQEQNFSQIAATGRPQ
ncbi:MAG: OB-fold protein [Janthinobacterium lividum]